MRVVVADCTAIYTGRGDTFLPRGIRAIILKEDGSASIHNDVGNKPLNYMKTAAFTESEEDGQTVWTFDARHENLKVTIHLLLADSKYPLLQDDPGLQRDGTENDLQLYLSQNPLLLDEKLELVGREFNTGDGPVDLLYVNHSEQTLLAVEVKRVAMMASVDQIRRYVEALQVRLDKGLSGDLEGFKGYKVRGGVAALDIRPKTYEMAAKRGMDTFLVDRDLWKDKTGSQSPEITNQTL